MSNIIFVAINKETGKVMSGAKGQYAFDNLSTLRRSVSQSYSYIAQRDGKKASDLYDIHEINLDKVLTPAPQNDTPFTVKETFGENSDGAANLQLEVNGVQRVNAYPLYECPEDATLERDLGYAFQIEELMREAYEAGKAGRPYEFTQESEEREEDE